MLLFKDYYRFFLVGKGNNIKIQAVHKVCQDCLEKLQGYILEIK